jgi:hypothetical protein
VEVDVAFRAPYGNVGSVAKQHRKPASYNLNDVGTL